VHVSPSGFPALVLNADFRPLSYYPLSLWSWQDAIKAVFLERVNIVANYDRAVHSPSFEMKLPSVVSLKNYVKPSSHPAFTRFNVFLRDRFVCQYCGDRDDLTFDHLVPRSRGGHTTWNNVVAACSPCNLRKGNLTPAEAKMWPSQMPFQPTAGSTISIGTQSSSRKGGGCKAYRLGFLWFFHDLTRVKGFRLLTRY
jgi:5-methylcytosine-specific restriction endonuclease McrA